MSAMCLCRREANDTPLLQSGKIQGHQFLLEDVDYVLKDPIQVYWRVMQAEQGV